MGQPTECPHANDKGNIVQHTTTGVAAYLASANLPTFETDWSADRFQSWALFPDGLRYMHQAGVGSVPAFSDADCASPPADAPDPDALSTYCAQVEADTTAGWSTPATAPAQVAAPAPVPTTSSGPLYLGQAPDACVTGTVSGVQIRSCTYGNTGTIWTDASQGDTLLAFGQNGSNFSFTAAGRHIFSLDTVSRLPQIQQPVQAGSLTLKDIDGLATLVADDGTFLGKVSSNKIDPDSICNSIGIYGSTISPTSVRNTISLYGSSISIDSAYNSITMSPPRITYGDRVLGYLTKNTILANGIDPDVLFAVSGCARN
jgi:hypothetical protein